MKMIKMIVLNAYQIMADVWVVKSGVWRGYTLKEKMKKIDYFLEVFFLYKKNYVSKVDFGSYH